MRNKTILDSIVLSILLVLLGLGAVFIIEKAFPDDFNQLTGHTIAVVNISASQNASCNTTIYPNWNLISFFCITTLEDMTTFATALPSHTTIFTYRSEDSSDPWKAYNPSLPSEVVQDLAYFSRRDAYWINFNIGNAANFYYDGAKRIPTNIEIVSGWNLVGYPTDIPEYIETAIASINDSYNIVYWYNNSNANYFNYTKGVGGSFNETKPYQGYWINSSASDTWVINW